jgi:hypothetical protein
LPIARDSRKSSRREQHPTSTQIEFFVRPPPFADFLFGKSSLDFHPAADSSAGNCPKTLVNPYTLKLLKAGAAGTWSCWLFVELCCCAWTSLLRTRLPNSVEEAGEIWRAISSSSSEGHKNQWNLECQVRDSRKLKNPSLKSVAHRKERETFFAMFEFWFWRKRCVSWGQDWAELEGREEKEVDRGWLWWWRMA